MFYWESNFNESQNIIKNNPLKPLSYHQIKLHDENIFLKDDKVKGLISNIRDTLYPKDDEYLDNIINTTITFDDKVPDSKNLPFCQGVNKFYNPQKKRIEEYIIFTTKYHLKILSKATHIFIDATFKSAPPKFY